MLIGDILSFKRISFYGKTKSLIENPTIAKMFDSANEIKPIGVI